MLKEIGSNFWLNADIFYLGSHDGTLNISDFGISCKETMLLSTGRAAILYALKDIKTIKGKKHLTALIPPYTCDTVLQPFIDENIDVYAYNVNDDLNINEEEFSDLLNKIQPDIVLIHRYFGFDTVFGSEKIINEYRNNGCFFIEDRTQSLFSGFSSLGVDYIVGSFRKWDAIPDGGFCCKVDDSFVLSSSEMKEDTLLVKSKLKAFKQKYEYMCKGAGDKELFLHSYKDAEEILDNEKELFCISDISQKIINSLDKQKLIYKRRNNYSFVYDNLDNKDVSFITGKLQDGIVPLYIVIRTPRRNELQQVLRNNDIYAPIVWPKPLAMPKVSQTVEDIYNEVLCLPIDQRYDTDDMERMVNIINFLWG